VFDDILLAGLNLPCDLEWVDEYGWSPVQSSSNVAINGALVFERSKQMTGRPITLQGGEGFGWMTRAQIIQLVAIADDIALGPHTLRMPDGVEYTVHFRHDGGTPAISATPLYPLVPPDDTDLYVVTIRLIEV